MDAVQLADDYGFAQLYDVVATRFLPSRLPPIVFRPAHAAQRSRPVRDHRLDPVDRQPARVHTHFQDVVMTISKRVIIGMAVTLVLTLSGAGAYLRINGHKTAAGATTEPRSGELPENSAGAAFSTDLAVPVQGAPVLLDTLVMSVGAPGEVASTQRATVRAQVSGQVRAVRVSENQAVSSSALLIEIDRTEMQLALDEAQARLRQAEVSYKETTLDDARIEDPRARAERDTAARARSGLDGAVVAVQRAELNLARTRIIAPFSGRIADVNVGDELLTIQSMDPVHVEAKVGEAQISYLAVGRTARVTFSAFAGEEFEGRIVTINPVVELPARTARVTVSVSNPRGRILPGMYAYVTLPAERFADNILVPREAIIERDRRTLVFVFEGDGDVGRAKWRYVNTGRANDRYVTIVRDGPEEGMVEPGEIVLVDGHYTLQHDIPVRLVEKPARAEGARPQ
jgi:membrane fusion protein, multidrug efflux system